MRYFQQFPITLYNDVLTADITKRVKFKESVKKQAVLFYDYTILDGQNIDAVAFDYYGDPYYFWVIALVNDIMDLNYDWPMSVRNFEKHMIKKYGSLALAQSTILHYEKTDTAFYVHIRTSEIATSAQYLAMPSSTQALYEPATPPEKIKISVETWQELTDDSDNYRPVYAYDYELSRNEEKRKIKLLDLAYLSYAEDSLKELLK